MENLRNFYQNTKLPKISVVMSAYNGAKYLKEAIESILNQTFEDFEFIIVDDDSIDKTEEILVEYKRKDPRIKIITNRENIGLTKSLNKAIKITKGDYIARMDADDIAMAERLETQLEFMKKNPEVGAVGCWYYLIDKTGNIFEKRRPPTKFSKIKKALLASSPLIHPGMFIKKEVLEKIGPYDEEFKYAQDRDLLFRILQYYKLAVVPQFLLKFRHTPGSISLKKEIEQKKYCLKAIKNAFKNRIYPKWRYIFCVPALISVHLPEPFRVFKNKIFNIIGLRHDWV